MANRTHKNALLGPIVLPALRDDEALCCPECGTLTSDGEYCGECLSERASYYHP